MLELGTSIYPPCFRYDSIQSAAVRFILSDSHRNDWSRLEILILVLAVGIMVLELAMLEIWKFHPFCLGHIANIRIILVVSATSVLVVRVGIRKIFKPCVGTLV